MSLMESKKSRDKRAWTYLLWALPLPIVFSCILLVVAVWNFCGINGCTGGGFGISRNVGGTISNLAWIPFLIGLPIFLVPWSTNRWLRAGVGLGVGLAFAGVGFALLVWRAS